MFALFTNILRKKAVACLNSAGLFRHEIKNILFWFWVYLRDNVYSMIQKQMSRL
jgi:hypothetical protein